MSHAGGRPPLPTHLKLVKGTLRKGRAPKNEPQPPAEDGIPEVPHFMSDGAKVEWGRVTQDLHTAGLLKRIDRAALAGYCEFWADFVDASKACATLEGKDRKVVVTRDGNVIENPYYSIKKRSFELMLKAAHLFGMNPSSRTQINSGNEAPKEPAAPSRWAGFRGK